MRTKTLALSAVLGMLGTASVLAQNVYSINAVGYINVSIPAGYSILTCPLICSPDNTLNTVLNNANGQYSGLTVFQYNNGVGFGANDIGNPASFGGGWANGGTDVTINPGQAVFVQNPNTPNAGGSGSMAATFVGTVPQGTLTVTMPLGYSLIGSKVPYSGDIAINAGAGGNSFPNMNAANLNSGDNIFLWDPAYEASSPVKQFGYTGPGDNVAYYGFSYGSWSGGSGPNGDPSISSVTQGFFYLNGGPNVVTWTENFSINP